MFGPILAFKPPETGAEWFLEAPRQLVYVSSSPTWELQACKPYSEPNSATFGPQNGIPLGLKLASLGALLGPKPPKVGKDWLLEPTSQARYANIAVHLTL